MPVLVSAYFRARRADGTHPRSAAACAISPDPRRFAGHRRGRDGRRAGKRQFVVVAFGLAVLAPTAARPGRVTRVGHQRQRLARPAEPRNDRHDDIPRPRIVRVDRRPGPRRFGPRVDGRKMGGLEPGFCGLCASRPPPAPPGRGRGRPGTRGPTVKYRERRPRTDRCPALAYPRPLPHAAPL